MVCENETLFGTTKSFRLYTFFPAHTIRKMKDIILHILLINRIPHQAGNLFAMEL